MAQNRSIPNEKSRTTVIRAEITREPKQPKRLKEEEHVRLALT